MNLIAYDRFGMASEVDAERGAKVGAVSCGRWNEDHGKFTLLDKRKISPANSLQLGLAVFIRSKVNLSKDGEVLVVVCIPAVCDSQIELVVRRRRWKVGDA